MRAERVVIVTGAAGFIGFHYAQRLLQEGYTVVGIDNLNSYYEASLKDARLQQLTIHKAFTFEKADIADTVKLKQLFEQYQPEYVVHLAAQAGVRYSVDNPLTYADCNLTGFLNILECCRAIGVKHLVYASSSSVYGANTKVPFSINDAVDKPISLYAATKRANELMAYTYSKLFAIPVTGLRFFAVYGPWGRPDMAYFKFTRNILADKAIEVYNHGKMERDFTYIADVVEGVYRVMQHPPKLDETDNTRYKLYNIGNNKPVALAYFIEALEKAIGKTAQKEFLPIQPGDVPQTYADIDELVNDFGFHPATPIEEGLQHFVNWYRQYYAV